MYSLLIADDHLAVRLGLEIIANSILGNCDVDFAQNGGEILRLLSQKKYDILFTDVNMPDTNSLLLIPEILAIQPDLKILVVTVNPEEAFAQRFLQAGALGFINKTAQDDELRSAMLKVSLGKSYLSGDLVDHFTQSMVAGSEDNPFDTLSSREFQIALLLLKGNGGIEMANALSLNTSTVSTYRARVFQKLKVTSIIELDRLARMHHLISDGSV